MSVELKVSLGKPFPAGGGRSTLDVRINPLEKQSPTSRHIALVVDASGSMGPNVSSKILPDSKIERARDGVLRVLDELEYGEDHVSIVSFNQNPRVLLEMTEWNKKDETEVREMITGTDDTEYDGEIEATGGTNIKHALEVAREQFPNGAGSRTVSRDVILLSDGKDTRDLEEFEDLAGEMREEGISISAGGIGSKYNEEVILALAEESGGEPYHIQDPTDIEFFLETQAKEAGDTIASNPELRLNLERGFVLDEGEMAHFTEPQIQTRSIQTVGEVHVINLPRIVLNRSQRLLVEALGIPQPTGLSYPMCELELVDGDGNVLAATAVKAKYEDDPEANYEIEKARVSAKITAEMKEPGADEAAIRSKIEALEKERGWTKSAAELRERLAQMKEAGGKIRISKNDVDTSDLGER